MKKFLFISIMVLLFAFVNFVQTQNEVIVDSNMTFQEAIRGTKAPKEIIDSLVLIDVFYYSFDKKLHKGQLVIHQDLKDEVLEIFEMIKVLKFPIGKVIPIVKYNWSDEKSMLDNNTSSFNYRTIAGTNRLSLHARGRAIDINPFLNPVVYSDGRFEPKGAKYEPKSLGTLYDTHPVVLEFKHLGWRWGGDFQSYKDYHHFDKEK
ncbi:M15 family peptidase [Bacteroidetes/Chlorobi group bacterium Naka2016]|nr:MAG: M15 family peptidase [Bacteroidetes/Chlorobi group bacterium Naka2016]